MSQVDEVLKKVKIGIRIMEKLNTMTDAEIKEFLADVLEHDKPSHEVVTNGVIARKIQSEKLERISVDHYNDVRIDVHGIQFVHEHGSPRMVIPFGDDFITRAIYQRLELEMNDPYSERSAEAREYEIEVCRISFAHATIKVMAHSQEEAESLALDEAGDHTYSEHDVDYQIS